MENVEKYIINGYEINIEWVMDKARWDVIYNTYKDYGAAPNALGFCCAFTRKRTLRKDIDGSSIFINLDAITDQVMSLQGYIESLTDNPEIVREILEEQAVLQPIEILFHELGHALDWWVGEDSDEESADDWAFDFCEEFGMQPILCE